MSNNITMNEAAQRATQILAQQPLSPTYPLRAKEPPVVAPSCIADLIAMHRLTRANKPGMVDAAEVEELFSRTRVITDTDLSVLRVSIVPLRTSGPCDPLRDGQPRRWAGWDFANIAELDHDEAWAGISGVWPLSEETARRARRSIFAPSVKGFVDGSLVRRVIGYHLDLVTRRRWIETEPLDKDARNAVFTVDRAGQRWEHLWISVPRGPIADLRLEAFSAEFTAQV